jgi:hypothetical protein
MIVYSVLKDDCVVVLGWMNVYSVLINNSLHSVLCVILVFKIESKILGRGVVNLDGFSFDSRY